MKSIKLSKYFELVKPKYVYIQVIPHKSIRNYNSVNIAKAIAYTFKKANRLIKIEQKKLFFKTNFKISYVIDIKKNNASFYFIVPKPFVNVILEKICEIWSKATVKVLDKALDGFTSNAEYYELSYKKEDALSLSTDFRSNEPLNSILNVMDVMKDDDRVTIIYNFIANPQFNWIDRYNNTMTKINENKSIDKNIFSFNAICRNTLIYLLDTISAVIEVINDFIGGNTDNSKEIMYNAILGILEKQEELSIATKKKKDSTVINTQIGVISDSVDDTRKNNNVMAITQSFRAIDGDNELIADKVKKPFEVEQYNFNTKISTLSVEESANLIQIPARTLLEQHKIDHVKVEETTVPDELKSGYISLGENKNKGNKIKTYLEDDYDIGSLPLMILGRQGGGKSTYLANYCKYAIERNESIFVIDYIKNCEMSKDIETVVPKDKLVILDFSKAENLQSFAYNELKFKEDTFESRYEIANKKSQLTLELVNSINVNGDPFSPKMERFLMSACDVVFTIKENATFKDIIRCLTDFKYREHIIESIQPDYKKYFEEDILTLEELDEWSKATKDNPSEKIGTRESKIEGILDRMTLLKRDFYLKMMFNKSPDNNVNFIDLMEQGKVVLIRLPQSKFKKYVKNVICTFFITKLWTSVELRGEIYKKPTRTHILIDELSQVHTAEIYLDSIITETRKYGFKPVLTGQRLFQLSKEFIEDLKSAGASFMLLKGSLKEDFNYFKEEISDDFTYEDLDRMEQYSSLNLIQYSKGFSSFITKLPKPV